MIFIAIVNVILLSRTIKKYFVFVIHNLYIIVVTKKSRTDWYKMNLPIRSNFIRCNLLASLRKYATTSPEIEQNEQVLIDDTDDVQAREAEIEKKRNKSKLSPAHYNLVNGRRPYVTPKSTAHLTVKYNRKMYGIYGVSSGVNPSKCFIYYSKLEQD